MKVALFHDANNTEAALAAGKIITDLSCTVEYHDTDKIWNRDYCLNPLKLLEHATHLLFIPSLNGSDLMSFYFLSGFCFGKGIRVIVLETRKAISIPDNIRHLGIFLKPESFEDFFLAEKERYYAEDRKVRAKAQLMERGYSCFEDNFVLVVNSGDAEAVSLFLSAGFDPSLVDAKGTPILSLAVRAQNLEIAKLLIDAGADVNRQSADRGYSPLMDASQKGDLAMARMLLEKGADPNLKSKDAQTALVICAGRNDVKLSELLFEYHANPAIPDNLGMSAETYARLFHNETLLALFNKSSS